MKLREKLFFFLLLLIVSIPVFAAKQPLAEKGILDLRGFDGKQDFIVNLNGEWEFYWKKMLHPHDFDGSLKPDYYGKVPSYWTDYRKDIITERYGFATYRLTVLLPQGLNSSVGIDLPVFDSSYDLYINGVS